MKPNMLLNLFRNFFLCIFTISNKLLSSSYYLLEDWFSREPKAKTITEILAEERELPPPKKLTILYLGLGMVGRRENLFHLHENLFSKSRLKTIPEEFALNCYINTYFTLGSRCFEIQLQGGSGVTFICQAKNDLKMKPDAVVWVVDSNTYRLEFHLNYLDRWYGCIEEDKEWFSQIPFVIQYNKRDLPNAAPIEELQELFNPWGFPHFSAVTTEGIGVMEPFQYCLEEIKKNVLAGKSSLGENWKDSALPITEKPPVDQEKG